MLRALGTTVVDMIFPPRCLACHEPTDAPHGLCAACWRDTHFIVGAACCKCGAPLMGEAGEDDVCERCRRHPPAWDRGAAAVVYGGAAKRVVLGLKHGDRLDAARPLGGWMARAGGRLIAEADLIAPTPLHWRRLISRRYNQSAELARRIGAIGGRRVVPDLLTRRRATAPQSGDRTARAANLADAIVVTRRRRTLVEGCAVLLVDDVLTSGATFSACAEALRAAGAARVDVLALARVAFADSPGL